MRGRMRRPVNIDAHPLLPVAPFRYWLTARLQRTGDSPERLSRVLGIDPSITCRVLGGDKAAIHVTVVDRALTRAGAHLCDLYPELYPEVDFNLFGEMYEVAA